MYMCVLLLISNNIHKQQHIPFIATTHSVQVIVKFIFFAKLFVVYGTMV